MAQADWSLLNLTTPVEDGAFITTEQPANTGEKRRPCTSGSNASRPGTSHSSSSTSSFGRIFKEMIAQNPPELPVKDYGLFSIPYDQFDNQFSFNYDMDFEMQDPSHIQQQASLYPDPTDMASVQPYGMPKNLPQPYGTMTSRQASLLNECPSPPAQFEIAQYNQKFANQQPDELAPRQYAVGLTAFDPDYSVPSVEKDDSTYVQSYDNTLDFGENDDDFEPNTINKRRKTSASRMRVLKKYNAEAPRKDPNKDWLRQNHATKGNSRTGKLNNFGHGTYAPTTAHPLGMTKWTSNATGRENRFAYNEWGELHGVCFPAAQINDFLYSHPFSRPNHGGQGKLILWIQKMAGDTARRAETQNSFSCRIKECPAGIYKKRTITTGHYRVAFDEQWETYGDHHNPLSCAGYAHLYCMERFLDFRQICRDLDVRADDREIEKEPTGVWTTGLGQKTQEYHVANSFIKFCKQGKSPKTWADYLQHDPIHYKRRKLPHDTTLTCKLLEAKVSSTGASKMRLMAARERSATQFFVNMGDLQLQIDTQQEKAAQKKCKGGATKRKLAKQAYDSDEELSDEDEDNADTVPALPAPIANMNRRTTRASVRSPQAQQGSNTTAPAEPSAPAFQSGPPDFTFETGAPLFAISNPNEAQIDKSERMDSVRSLCDKSEDMQISPKSVPKDMIDPALRDQPQKQSDEFDSMGFFALNRR